MRPVQSLRGSGTGGLPGPGGRFNRGPVGRHGSSQQQAANEQPQQQMGEAQEGDEVDRRGHA